MKPIDLIPETSFRLTTADEHGNTYPTGPTYMVRSHNPVDTRTINQINRGVRLPEPPVTACGHDRVDVELQNGMRICVPAAMELARP